jgi:DNA repair exonuclease SbcCD ATPase subunit
MPSKLDALIEFMGECRKGIKNLEERAAEDREQHAREQEQRAREHQQNQEAISTLAQAQQSSMSELRRSAVDRWDSTTAEIAGLREDLREHAETVRTIQPKLAAIEPKIADLQMGRGKLAALAAVGFAALFAIGKALEMALAPLIAWIVNKIMH